MSVLTSFLFNYRLENDFDTFKNTIFRRPFFFLKIFYSPKGAAIAAPMGSILTSFLFNYRLGNGFGNVKITIVIRLFEILKMFYLRMGWDGMDGWMGYQKCPSISFILSTYIEHGYMY